MAAVLWSEGISRIDVLVLSHADTDHFNAVPELLDRFAVGRVVVPGAFLHGGSSAVVDLLGRLRARHIPVEAAAAGDSFALDAACRVRVLHPFADEPPAPAGIGGDRRAADNATSLVVAVESAGRRLLLTGDIEGDAVARFVAADPDSCDVLVAPHHGSRTSLPPDVATATEPAVVLVSGAGGRGWDDVRDAYAAACGAAVPDVLQTGGGGAIAVDFAAAAIEVSRFAAADWRPTARVGDGAAAGVRPLPVRQVASAPGPRR